MFKSEKILLVGGSGFIGTQVKKDLLKNNYTGITSLYNLDSQEKPSDYFDVIINCSAPNYSLLKFLISVDSKHFVHLSSARVYNSSSEIKNESSSIRRIYIKKLFAEFFFSRYDYAEKKIICDLLIQKLPDYHLVRPTIVMGPGDTSARWKHVMTFRNRNSVDIPYLENSLNIVDVRDVAEGVVSSLLSSGQRATNITGELVSWESFWKKIGSILNFKINWVTPTYESKKFPYFNYFNWKSVTSLRFKNKIGFEESIIDAAYFNN